MNPESTPPGLAGRVALVTGGGRGIGRAICLALARDGADVAINYRRDDDAAEATAADVRALGQRAITYRACVDSFEEDSAMVATVLEDFGFVDILVNNAGIASRGSRVSDTDPEELARVLAVHAAAPHHLSKLVLPSMRTRPRGDIVMISSVATKLCPANGAPYTMGKAAAEALMTTMSKEERANAIRVNAVAPGLVVTDMGRRLVKATGGVADIGTLDPLSPFGRVCRPEDVAETVRFLVSEAGGYISGQRIYVDGGS